MSKIQFEFDVEANFTQSLQLAEEIVNEMGMTPTHIITADQKRVKYNPDSALVVLSGDMTESEYIQKYIVE